MDTIRGRFFKQHILSDQFLDLIEKNKRPRADMIKLWMKCGISMPERMSAEGDFRRAAATRRRR